MNNIYCQSCFKKTPQTTDLVKFCAHCGKPFLETGASSHSQHKELSNSSKREELQKRIALAERKYSIDYEKEEDEDDGDSNDNETELDTIDNQPDFRHSGRKSVGIEVELPTNNGVPIRHVARSAKRTPKPETKRGKFNKKKFWEQFRKEASALRPNK